MTILNMAYQMCYGKYVANDPCAPFCSKPDGSGCDYSPLANPSGANPFGKTGDPYSVTYSDQGSITGNFTQRTYVPTIDPYQVQTPPKNFHGFASNREEFMTFSDYSSEPCAFANQSGSAESITQDGNTTTLTAVPRFSTRNFFKQGEMDGLSQRASSTKRWCHCFNKNGVQTGKCQDENPTITGKRCHCCKQFDN